MLGFDMVSNPDTLTSKERIARVMRGERPDRPPVMCQLAWGHVYSHAGLDPVDFWYTHEGRAEGFIRMADRYNFDGILTNVVEGIDPALRDRIIKVEKTDKGHLTYWKDGREILIPFDDDPLDCVLAEAEELCPEDIDEGEVIARFDKPPEPYALNVLNELLQRRGDNLSIHGEVWTTFEHILLVFGNWDSGLIALMDDPDLCLRLGERINEFVLRYALLQCEAGIDALKLSCPFAGEGFISREFYRRFVLPFNKQLISSVHEKYDIPCYIHTCGSIGDRLDLILESGVDGVECLDPPPLGNVDLAQAVEEYGDRIFIKGNLDSVNELTKSPEEVRKIVSERIRIGSQAKGYIVSSACSVSPKVPPENVALLHDIACEHPY